MAENSNPRPILKELTVPPDDLVCPEYCFKLHANFNKSLKKDPGVSNLKTVLSGLLNTSGGAVFIDRSQVKHTKLDSWKCDLEDALTAFIPVDVFRKCVLLRECANRLVLLVKKSPVLITVKSSMHIRGLAANREVNDINVLRDVVTQKTEKETWTSPVLSTSVQYNTELHVSEGPNIEFKNWKAVKSFDGKGLKDTYKKRLGEIRTLRTMLAMPNMSEGGILVLGIEDDSLRALGQIVSEEDEKRMTKFIEEQLTSDEHGYPRLWSENKSPTRGKDWDIRFIEVTGGPPKERRRVVEISFKHFDGGVFRHHPEAYLIDENGYLIQMDAKQWFQRIKASKTEYKEAVCQTTHARPLESPAATLQRTRVTVTRSTVSKLQNRQSLSWTKHTRNWRKYMTDRTSKINEMERTSLRSGMFELSSPMTLTPTKEHLVRSGNGPALKKAVEHIEQTTGRGFGIASAQWSTLIDTNQINKRPQHVLMDVLTVDQNLVIKIWTVLDNNISDFRDIWKYLFVSSRSIKREILLNEHSLSSLFVECVILKPDNTILSAYPGSIFDTVRMKQFFLTTDSLLNSLKCSLAKTLSRKRTRISNNLGDEHSLNMTHEQMDSILNVGLDKFSYIEGPPGSGKSTLGLHLSQNLTCGYVCTTYAFMKFLEFQKVEHLFHIEKDGDLHSLITGQELDDLEFLVVDDIHNISFKQETWESLFDFVASSIKMKLVLLADSSYQDYTNNVWAKDYLLQYCQRKSYNLMHKVLSVVCRNTRKIVSYMKSNFIGEPGYPESTNISCARMLDGDDVEIRVLSNIFELNSSNSLVEFVKSLVCVRGTLMNESCSYRPEDIAILVDRKCTDVPNRTPDNDVERLMAIFRQDASVQSAETYPVQGYTIDTVDNFVGLERGICIIICSSDIISDDVRGSLGGVCAPCTPPCTRHCCGRSLANPRYRTFLASRAISRVVFVVDKLMSSLVENFGLDNLPSPPTILWHMETGKEVLDACFVEKNNDSMVLYTTGSAREMMAVSLKNGKPHFDKTTGLKNNLWLASNACRKDEFIYSGCDDLNSGPCVWASGRMDGIKFITNHKYELDARVQSIHCTTAHGVVMILFQVKDRQRTLVKYSTITGEELWHLNSEATHLTYPGRVCGSTERDRLYVSDQGSACIRELTPHGEHLRDIPTHPIQSPRAICVDSEQKILFVSDVKGGDVFQIDIYSGAVLKIIQCGEEEVFNLSLHEDRYLVVTSSEGIALYDIGNV